MQDNVALPDPVTLLGLTVHEVLFVVKLTTPVKPFCAVIVMVEVPATLALTVTLVGLALIAKSGPVATVTMAWRIRPALVPVTVTV